jgi:RNA polymerase sigma-70 factor (ECF subfamily)
MPDAGDPFNSLLNQARQGDAEAIAEIVRLYEPEVRRAARVLLGPALRPLLDSVDLAQSIHRSVLVHLRSGKFEVNSPDHLMALALTMARRHIARHWRRIRREVRVPAETVEDPVATGPQPDADDPARQVEHAEQIEHVLGRLSEVDRRLIELRLLGHSTADAARTLNLDPDVARVRLSRLRARLRLTTADPQWV